MIRHTAISVFCLCVTALAQSTVKPQAYWTAAGAAAFTTALDGYTTVAYNNRICPVETGTPQLYGRVPHAGRVSFAMAGEFVLAAVASWRLGKSKRTWLTKLWAVPLSYEAVVHAKGAALNLAECRP